MKSQATKAFTQELQDSTLNSALEQKSLSISATKCSTGHSLHEENRRERNRKPDGEPESKRE